MSVDIHHLAPTNDCLFSIYNGQFVFVLFVINFSFLGDCMTTMHPK